MGKTKNYVQVPCYLNIEQKKTLEKVQEEIFQRYKFKIPIAELIRDAVVGFWSEKTPKMIKEYMKQKGMASTEDVN
jgi:hypothetical protein